MQQITSCERPLAGCGADKMIPVELNAHYLLLIGDVDEPGFAKTALGVVH